MSRFIKHKQKIIGAVEAGLVLIVLFCLLLIVVFRYDFSHINIYKLAFFLAVVVIFFIVNQIYESDISEAKILELAEEKAQKKILSSEQLFTEVYSHSPVSYLILNEQGKITSANLASYRLFGISIENLQMKDFFTLITYKDDDNEALLKEKFKQGVAVADEEVEILQGVKKIWTTLSVFRFSNNEGKRLNLVTLVDMTKQKEVETAKSEFVSLASHQLRTPISGMRWSAELLLMDGIETLKPQQRRYVDRLLAGVNRMSSLVDDFLEVSRFELGTRILKLEDVNLFDLCEDVISDQAEKSAGKRIKITRKFDQSVVKIQTDLSLIKIIITNLFTNAVKYTRIGGDITVGYEKINDSELQIQVKDNGMGIPIAEQARIFEKIFRATNAVKEVPDGTGLGLYMVRKSVEQLGGRISFASGEDTGTTFTVVIPLAN